MVHRKLNSISIFILIDALGYEFIKDKNFLSSIGIKTLSRVKTICGYSSAVVPSIISGKSPAEHGLWSLYYYSPKTSVFKWTRLLKRLSFDWLLERGKIREVIKDLSVRFANITGDFNLYRIPTRYLWLFEPSTRKDVFYEGVAEVVTIFDRLKELGISFEFLSKPGVSDSQRLDRASQLLDNSSSGFYFIYLGELDAFLHAYPKESEEVRIKLGWYEDRISSLYEKAFSRAKEANLYVFSDHGMVTTVGTFNLMHLIEQLGYKMPQDYVVFYDSTMARFWFFSDDVRKDIENLLSKVSCGTILSRDDLERMGIFFKDYKYGELIFSMSPGWIIEPNFMMSKTPVGMHGFCPDAKDLDAVFLSNIEICPLPKDVRDYFWIMTDAAKGNVSNTSL